MKLSIFSRPPLPCRASPPQGRRSDVVPAFANLHRTRSTVSKRPANLPPLAGEMPGRAEGGNVGHQDM
ncbi:hypothetical protein C7I85_25735 [Mesorhizobium soli]|uniref:Propionyl-coenzyme A carboxylase alpha polypeptide n=1 Tax=Pseudaminobacter soli (ex Li et al. 2025) TaxID=1295366 RepID=A0A2P7S0C3_9HYPH|nr:hypothetical protein C7I85_25735 [Mesorhizobium soli]